MRALSQGIIVILTSIIINIIIVSVRDEIRSEMVVPCFEIMIACFIAIGIISAILSILKSE